MSEKLEQLRIEIKADFYKNKKIRAIKDIMATIGWSLKESKYFVDILADNPGILESGSFFTEALVDYATKNNLDLSTNMVEERLALLTNGIANLEKVTGHNEARISILQEHINKVVEMPDVNLGDPSFPVDLAVKLAEIVEEINKVDQLAQDNRNDLFRIDLELITVKGIVEALAESVKGLLVDMKEVKKVTAQARIENKPFEIELEL